MSKAKYDHCDMSQYAEYEASFVKNFIRKNFQSRALFELQSEEKRHHFFSRLCHDHDRYFDPKYIQALDLMNPGNNVKMLQALPCESMSCFTMAYDAAFDRQYMKIDEAITLLYQTEMPLILLVEKTIAIFQIEASFRKPLRFLLQR